jgi:hypothetical protein
MTLVELEPPMRHTHHTICIPRVHNKISKQFIFSIFCNLKIGFVEKVIEIPIKNEEFHKRVIVKIKWNTSNLSNYISSRFENGQNVKIMYSEPSYWICVPNYTRIPVSNILHPYDSVNN